VRDEPQDKRDNSEPSSDPLIAPKKSFNPAKSAIASTVCDVERVYAGF
jgi:hypothetical protein